MTFSFQTSRRRVLGAFSGLALVGASPMVSSTTFHRPTRQRDLAMNHTHTNERLDLVYAVGQRYLPQALVNLDHFLRDHYSGIVGSMDPGLYDIMHKIRLELKVKTPFHIISGYRSPDTNEHLRVSRGGGVARRSLHMDGKAIDLRIPGVPLKEVRDAALSLNAGGVGYYPRDRFIHIDTGKVRSWKG
ncbi:MAG: DUF882 domain-containing protein [Alcaligenaceae bacterium]|nr:DUF882 domain-containing protein [Alcaligenaceae bacterium]